MFQPEDVGQIPTTQFNIPAPKKRGGMFGGSAMRGIAGSIGDYLLQMNGMQPMYAPAMQEQQRMRYLQEQYQRQRMDSRDDWLWKQQNETPQPTELERLIQAAGIAPGSPEYGAFAKKMLDVKTNPMVMTPYGPMPYSAVSGGGQQSLPPVLSDDDFAPQGGPSPLGSGGFPRSF